MHSVPCKWQNNWGNENNTRMMPKKKDWAEVIDAGGSKEDPGQKKSKEDWEEVLE